jgi:hypothetical protein
MPNDYSQFTLHLNLIFCLIIIFKKVGIFTF